MTAGSSSSDSTTPRERPPGSSSSSVPRPSGLVLSPFRALRYDTTTAGNLHALTSPPYDVIDEDGVAALESASEHNVVRLILPRDPGGRARGPPGRGRRTARARRAPLAAAGEHAGVRPIPPRGPADGSEDRYGRAARTLTAWRDRG